MDDAGVGWFERSETGRTKQASPDEANQANERQAG
jgi:hypothetical protein